MKWFAVLALAGGLVGASPAADGDLHTEHYVVPATFQIGLPSLHWRDDPFSDIRESEEGPTAEEILERAGITFGHGASGFYNRGTSSLIVRNTREQLRLVEAYLESILPHFAKRIYLTFRKTTLTDEEIESSAWLSAPEEDGARQE